MIARRTHRLAMTLAASGVLLGVVAAPRLRGDEPSRLGRLFRLGGNGNSAKSADPTTIGKSSSAAKSDGAPRSFDPPVPAASLPGTSLAAYPTSQPPPIGAGAGGIGNAGAASRISPQPRATRAATEADPMVTRISLGRSDDGKPFCMFLQVYADGTVLDSEGAHRVGADLLRPIALLIQSGELEKLKGYCGGPAADFIEQVQIVTYDRYRGKLRANAFSHSGNPQGCDTSVKTLNAALDALQAKLAGPPSTGSPAPATTAAHAGVPSPRDLHPIGLSPDSPPGE